ncbi:MAG: hypothetical protein ABSB78_14775 [Bacteroidota bacterium]|jgi:hypothetical protein
MAIRDIEDEIKETERQRKMIYWVGLVVLIGVAIFIPERYAVLCFLGAIVATLFEISRKLLDIYYSNRAKLDTMISILLSISTQLQEKERAIK